MFAIGNEKMKMNYNDGNMIDNVIEPSSILILLQSLLFEENKIL
jgi:hypothetical protein